MRRVLVSFGFAAVGLHLVGCTASASTEMTPQEQKNFSGGPRPANANEMMQKSIEEYRKKHPLNGTAPQPPAGGK